MCSIIAGIKKCKSIIKENKKKLDKVVLLGKHKLNSIEVLFSRDLIGSYISHDRFLWVNCVLIEYNEKKEQIKKCWNFCRIYTAMVTIKTDCVVVRKMMGTKI